MGISAAASQAGSLTLPEGQLITPGGYGMARYVHVIVTPTHAHSPMTPKLLVTAKIPKLPVPSALRFASSDTKAYGKDPEWSDRGAGQKTSWRLGVSIITPSGANEE